MTPLDKLIAALLSMKQEIGRSPFNESVIDALEAIAEELTSEKSRPTLREILKG